MSTKKKIAVKQLIDSIDNVTEILARFAATIKYEEIF